ncbi:MAG: hypothetical protein ABSG86_01775 [Thermoguttaceae bacterium]|jgi:hypothetical protein
MTSRRLIALWIAAAVWSPAAVLGQSLQLPTYSFTSVSTTVSVPDQGAALLGGISRSSESRSEFGVPMLPFRPFRNTAIGQSSSAMNMYATATIHDFDAMEAALLGTPSPGGVVSADSPAAAAALARMAPSVPPKILAGQWQPKADPPGATSPVADPATEQARRLAQREVRSSEAEQYFERARQAEADGKPSVAKIYYQMVVRRAGGDLKSQALARLDALGSTTARLVQGQP